MFPQVAFVTSGLRVLPFKLEANPLFMIEVRPTADLRPIHDGRVWSFMLGVACAALLSLQPRVKAIAAFDGVPQGLVFVTTQAVEGLRVTHLVALRAIILKRGVCF